MAGKDRYFGSHELQGRDEKVKTSSDRGFGIVFCVFCALVAALSWYHDGTHWPWWLGASALFLLFAFVYPRALAPLNWVWTKLGLLLFMVISPIALGIVFYLCVAPIGLILRLFGKDVLSLRRDPASKSYWVVRTPPGPPRDSFERQF